MSKKEENDEFKIIEILQSYRSDDDSDENYITELPKTNKEEQTFDDHCEFQIRETLDLQDDDSPPYHQKSKKEITKKQEKEKQPTYRWERQEKSNSNSNRMSYGTSEISDWNEGDTDEIITETKKDISKSKTNVEKKTTRSQIKKEINSDDSDDNYWGDSSEIKVQQTDQKSSSQLKDKEKNLKIEIKEEKYLIHTNPDEDEVIDIGKSLFTSKQSSNQIKKIQKKESSAAHEEKKVTSYQFLKDPQKIDDFNASIHLTGAPTLFKKSIGIQLKTMDRRMFWKGSEDELEVTFEIVNLLIEEFLKNDIILPLIDQEQLESDYTIEFMKKFTSFLNKLYYDEFKKNFKSVKKALNFNIEGSRTSSSGLTSPRGPSANSIKFEAVIKYISTNILNKKRYSKAQLLRNCLVNKFKTMRVAEQLLKDGIGEQTELTQLNENTFTNESQSLKTIKKEIGSLQLLISFQNAQNYCKSKYSQQIQQKIWKDRENRLLEKKKKWMEFLQKESTKQMGSFKV